MQVIVDKHTVTINKNEIVNEGEYNVQACNFQFSSEYDGLPKIAIFKTDTVTKQILLSGDSCITPSEVLESTGIVGLGVYAYENDGDNLILRYSPTPAVFTVEPGSYDEGDAPTPPTPSEIEQLQAQITENANNISSLQDVTNTHTTQIETLQTDVNNIKSEQITQNQNIQTNTNNIQTNTSDIINIKSEQTTQNQNISQNTNDITDIKSEQVTQNTNIQNNTNDITTLQNDLSSEITNRQNADINLQSQIDAITSSSDVVDIVGTYAQLQSYDTQHLQNNDVIKVLQDETHDNAMTYYRWLKNTSTWQYIGQEGPYYTKSETDTLLQGKANVNDVYSKGQIDTKLEDYALKTDLNDFVTEQDVDTKLEDYVETTTYTQGQATQDANIEENATNINWLQTLVNQMPTVSGQGTDLSLQDVLNYRLMKFLPQGSSSQDGEPTPTTPISVKSVTGENSLVISNVNLFDDELENGGLNSDGLNQVTPQRVRTKGYLLALPNTTYIVPIKKYNTSKGSLQLNINYYNANDFTTPRIGSSGWHGNNYSFTTPEGCKFIRILLQISNQTITTDDISEVMLVKGSTAPSTYVEHEEQNYQLSLGNIKLNSSPDGTVRDEIIGSPNNWFKREYIGKTTDVSGSTSITINDMVSDSGFYSYYGGTLNGKTITYASAISGTNTILYQKSQYTDIPITDTTLISQLNDIYNNAHSYNGVTNITTTYEDGNEQMYLDIDVLKNVWSEV